MQYLNKKLILIIFSGLSFGVIACISPKSACEQSIDPDGWGKICAAELATFSDEDCWQRESMGAIPPGSCVRTQQVLLLTCLEYLDRRNECENEPAIPFFPKIVYKFQEKAVVLSFMKSNVKH